MALTLTGMADARAALGPSNEDREWELQPAASDYPTNGYVITALQVGLSYIFAAWIVGVNANGALYLAQFVFPSGSMGATPQPATSINLKVVEQGASAGPFTEVANGTDLSGVTWFAMFRGY